MKKLIILFMLAYTSSSYANPSPLGITPGKSTLSDVKEKYNITKTAENALLDGYHNSSLNTKNINIDTLSNVVVASNDKGVVEAVSLTLDKTQFNEMYQTLSGKYKLIKSQIPFVGSKLVEFQDDECDIIIDSPHMSFTMDVIYATNAFSSKAYKEVKKQEQDKKEHTKEMF